MSVDDLERAPVTVAPAVSAGQPLPTATPGPPLPDLARRVALAARAAYILRDNSSGTATRAGPALYPHQWSWDAGFTAIGLARVDVARAAVELDSLFRGQWRTGMQPHIVFDAGDESYFPTAERWDCAALSPDAPQQPTSGICQPPVHALAAERVLAAAGRRGPREAEQARAWAGRIYPRLLAWHRYLQRCRVDPGTGLLEIHHSWESGLDDSPRWDEPYRAVVVGAGLPPYRRRDLEHVADPAQRPSDAEYDRYLWLVEEAKRARYDPARMREDSSFRVGDVLFTALFAAAGDALARLADRIGAGEGPELRAAAAAARRAVLDQVDAGTGLAADVDLRTGRRLPVETVAGFAPLIAGRAPAGLRARQVELLLGPRWCGHPGLRWPLPPSTSPCADQFRPRTYWRGPVWPVMTWLLAWALDRDGEGRAAAGLREAGLAQLDAGDFAEYYEPFTGEPLGSCRQSWTAAVALDWLA